MTTVSSFQSKVATPVAARTSQHTTCRAAPVRAGPPPKLVVAASTSSSVASGFSTGAKLTVARRAAARHVSRKPLAVAAAASGANSSFDEPVELDNTVAMPMERKKRWAMVWCLFAAFVLCNLDKVNMSVAMVPMAKAFGWTGTQTGLVQSAFFWGYMVTQFPGGFLASKYGGARVLLWGVILWSFGTLIAPMCAHMGMTALLASRFVVGLGEGVAPSAATGVLAAAVPLQQRSRATAAAFGGLDVGSLVGLLVAPALILSVGGWPTVFYLFGALGFVWAGWWYGIHIPEMDKASKSSTARVVEKTKTPWKAILSHPQLYVISVAHFSWNWFSYGLLAFLPSFLGSALKLDLTNSSMLTILPYASAIVSLYFIGNQIDGFIKTGRMSITQARKFSQSVCCIGGAVCCALVAATLVTLPASGPTTITMYIIMALLVATFACGAFCRTGLLCTHQDISPKYASLMLGFTNTIAAAASAMSTFSIGYLLDYTGGNWALALFVPMVVLNLVSATIFCLLYSSEPVDFDALQKQS